MEAFITKFVDGAGLITEKLAGWTEQFILLVPNMVLSLVVMVLFILLAKFVKNLSKRGLRRAVDSEALISLTSTIIQMLVVIAGFLIALNLLNLEKTVTSILAGAGVIGLALGFAFQETASNFIAGVFLATNKPIKIGDMVTIDSEHMGIVERIDLRATIIRMFQGQLLIIPNKDVFQNEILNYDTGERRVDLECGVSYGDDLEKVEKVAVEAIEALGIKQEGKDVELFYSEFGSSSINFSLRFWIDFPGEQPSFLEARSKAVIALKKAFDENDITIPFPIRTLDFGIKGGGMLREELADMKVVNED